MNKIYYICLSLLLISVSSCETNRNHLSYKVSLTKEDSISQETAEKIAFSYVLEHGTGNGVISLDVSKMLEESNSRCFNSPEELKIFGEFCGAKYYITTEYVKYEGYSAYRVLETCENSKCKYTVSTIDEGIIE